MKNTYINDNLSALYPFAIDQQLPFSLSCIAGCGVCVTGATGSAVYLSGLEVAEDRLAADVMVGSELCGRLEYANGRCLVRSGASTNYAVTGWLLPGTVSATDYGVYDGPFKLDPRCITWLASEEVSRVGALEVNGTAYAMPSALTLMFNGYFTLGGAANTLDLLARIPEDAVLTVAPRAAAYPVVTHINENPVTTSVPVDPSQLPGGYTLILDVDPDIATVSVQNGMRASEMLAEDASDGPLKPSGLSPNVSRRDAWSRPSLFDKHGGVVVVTVNGNGNIPNCYGDEDEGGMNEEDNAEL